MNTTIRRRRTVIEIAQSPERTRAILQYLSIVGHWHKQLYTNKGLPYMTKTEDEKELRIIEESAKTDFNDGRLVLSTSLQCWPYSEPVFFHSASYDYEKLSVVQLKKYLARPNDESGLFNLRTA